MASLGASKLDLSSISSQELWTKSGRLTDLNSELFLFTDRKDTGYLLSPTHEEEITMLLAGALKSYKELPIRLYQISRKYRDELRPRHGLLRSREFVMKDLYTFDLDSATALQTYKLVCAAYRSFFDELKLPYLVAEADSGEMGGSISHEFHFPTPVGEDRVISCTRCDYVANEELAECSTSAGDDTASNGDWSFLSETEMTHLDPTPCARFTVWRGITRDRMTLVNVWYPSMQLFSQSSVANGTRAEINIHAVKAIVPEVDPSVEDSVSLWNHTLDQILDSMSDGSVPNELKIVNLVDRRLPMSAVDAMLTGYPTYPVSPFRDTPGLVPVMSTISKTSNSDRSLNLLRIKEGDHCPRCAHGSLTVQKAIELGHTFFLGTRYSEPLKAMVTVPVEHLRSDAVREDFRDNSNKSNSLSHVQIPVQMGCHGIGISRMMGAVAETLADEKGLNWPRSIAPYEVVIVPTRGLETESSAVYDALSGNSRDSQPCGTKIHDLVLDDRKYGFAWKMRDADLIGYPVVVVVGKDWKTGGTCEVQCRRLNIRENVPIAVLSKVVEGLLVQL
ncbi:MAG: hypothetical protein M1818_006590 [Claussenomyces sp. TS43310]|nr:MAG: hypothetical protein M1818_006590 [Claussenomyces sp. TS43310]